MCLSEHWSNSHWKPTMSFHYLQWTCLLMHKRIAKWGEQSSISEQRNSLLFRLSSKEQDVVNIPVYKITPRYSWQLQGSQPWLTACTKKAGQQVAARCLLLKCLQVFNVLLFDCSVANQRPWCAVQQCPWPCTTESCHSRICTNPHPLTDLEKATGRQEEPAAP